MNENTETVEIPPHIQGIISLPRYNFTCAFGDESSKISVQFNEEKTLTNRIKWWLFCKVFPIRIKEWVKE